MSIVSTSDLKSEVHQGGANKRNFSLANYLITTGVRVVTVLPGPSGMTWLPLGRPPDVFLLSKEDYTEFRGFRWAKLPLFSSDNRPVQILGGYTEFRGG